MYIITSDLSTYITIEVFYFINEVTEIEQGLFKHQNTGGCCYFWSLQIQEINMWQKHFLQGHKEHVLPPFNFILFKVTK